MHQQACRFIVEKLKKLGIFNRNRNLIFAGPVETGIYFNHVPMIIGVPKEQE